MPSANTGKKIKSIKVYKDHVTLTFVKHDSLKISKEAYLSSYLYVGKSLSNKEIDKLNELTNCIREIRDKRLKICYDENCKIMKE